MQTWLDLIVWWVRVLLPLFIVALVLKMIWRIEKSEPIEETVTRLQLRVLQLERELWEIKEEQKSG